MSSKDIGAFIDNILNQLNSPNLTLTSDIMNDLSVLQNLVNQNKTTISNDLTNVVQNLANNQMSLILAGKIEPSQDTLDLFDTSFDLIM